MGKGEMRVFSRRNYEGEGKGEETHSHLAVPPDYHLRVFEFTSDDLLAPYFHPKANRSGAIQTLESADIGAYLVRYSSSPHHFAASYVTPKQEVKHLLIVPRYPGFSLENSTDRYPTLKALIQESPKLIHPIVHNPSAPISSHIPTASIEGLLLYFSRQLENTNDALDFCWILQDPQQVKQKVSSSLSDPPIEDHSYTIVRCKYMEYRAQSLYPMVYPLIDTFIGHILTPYTLSSISLCGSRYTPCVESTHCIALLEHLVDQPSLKHVDMRNNQLGDDIIPSLTYFIVAAPGIEKMSFSQNQLSAQGLVAIGNAIVERERETTDRMRYMDHIDCDPQYIENGLLSPDPYAHTLWRRLRGCHDRYEALLGKKGDGKVLHVNMKVYRVDDRMIDEKEAEALAKRHKGKVLLYLHPYRVKEMRIRVNIYTVVRVVRCNTGIHMLHPSLPSPTCTLPFPTLQDHALWSLCAHNREGGSTTMAYRAMASLPQGFADPTEGNCYQNLRQIFCSRAFQKAVQSGC